MNRVFGAAVSALLLVCVTALTGCSSSTPSPASTPTAKVIDRHVVPKQSAFALENFESVSSVDVDLHTAVQTREAVESEFKTTYGRTGHPRWFFHAFDVANLDFIVARYEPTSAKPSRYVAERRIRVRRSNEAERELGVMEVVFSYERSTRGLKVGMSKKDVVKISGRPETERPLGRPGTYDLRYSSFCVHFVDNKVAHLWRREQCLR